MDNQPQNDNKENINSENIAMEVDVPKIYTLESNF
jgi:hypothetical protein